MTESRGNLTFTVTKPRDNGLKLKLKLKRSPISESFEVVRDGFGPVKDDEFIEEEKSSVNLNNNKVFSSKLAESKENDMQEESKEEVPPEESFENVILNSENDYEDENFESELDHNPLESFDRPLMDHNEGDSGVGSDSINPLEKEDQNVDDLHNSDSNHALEGADNEEEQEDEAESDALEACRETIENLKKLGEQTRYVFFMLRYYQQAMRYTLSGI